MQYDHISTDQQLQQFCSDIADADAIGFDTEFVSEDTYRPDLCLIQVAAAGRLAIIDPKAVTDVTPFWQLIAQPGHVTIVHAGREEFRFCVDAVGKRPNNFFDLQIAAGLVGLEYPASYGKLVQKLLDESLAKGETRTDWRRRPLTDRQLDYALLDVCYLEPMHDQLTARLKELGRLPWLATEMESWQGEIEQQDSTERWRRISGVSSLSTRSLAVARELWRWRDEEAKRRNRPVKRVLRDDLIVELARRQSADARRIRAVRGMERSDIKKYYDSIIEAIARALALPNSECPATRSRRSSHQQNTVSQFLSTALNSICRTAEIAPGIVATVQDVRELVAFLLDDESEVAETPVLAQGWRAEIVGQQIEMLLNGEMSIRIQNPKGDIPLVFEKRPGSSD